MKGSSSVSPNSESFKANHLLTRIASLERENIDLQEEVLMLKKQIMSIKTKSGSQPSSPAHKKDDIEAMDETIESLKAQVNCAIIELKKFRVDQDGGIGPNQTQSNTFVSKQSTTGNPHSVPRVTNLQPQPQVKITTASHPSSATRVQQAKPKRTQEIDLDDLLN